jgi:hypothetical protein
MGGAQKKVTGWRRQEPLSIMGIVIGVTALHQRLVDMHVIFSSTYFVSMAPQSL